MVVPEQHTPTRASLLVLTIAQLWTQFGRTLKVYQSVAFFLEGVDHRVFHWCLRPLIGNMVCMWHLPCLQKQLPLQNTQARSSCMIHLQCVHSLATTLAITWSTGSVLERSPILNSLRFSMSTGSVLKMDSSYGLVS